MPRIRWAALAAVALLVLALAGAGCGGNDKKNPAGGNPAADVTIQIVAMDGSNSYSPNPASVNAGQTVAWHNADNVTHTATANNSSFTTGNIGPGSTSSPITMSTAGSIAYHCALHPSMVGTLQVNP